MWSGAWKKGMHKVEAVGAILQWSGQVQLNVVACDGGEYVMNMLTYFCIDAHP